MNKTRELISKELYNNILKSNMQLLKKLGYTNYSKKYVESFTEVMTIETYHATLTPREWPLKRNDYPKHDVIIVFFDGETRSVCSNMLSSYTEYKGGRVATWIYNGERRKLGRPLKY